LESGKNGYSIPSSVPNKSPLSQDDYTHDSKNDLGPDLGQYLGDVLGRDLRDELGHELGDDLGHELGDDLGHELGDDLGHELGDDLGHELGDDLENGLRRDTYSGEEFKGHPRFSKQSFGSYNSEEGIIWPANSRVSLESNSGSDKPAPPIPEIEDRP
jgi:hypothetical protein